MENTDKRIKELEKTVKRMRAGFAVLVIVALAGGLMAANGDEILDVVKCRELVLVGPDGEILGNFAKGEGGSYGFNVFDQNGKLRIGMGYSVPAKGFGVATYNTQGIASATIGIHVSR